MSNTPKTRILLINAEGTHHDDVSAHLEDSPHYSVIKANSGQVPELLAEEEADMVIVDLEKLGEAEVQILTSVTGQAPSTPLIVVSHDLDAGEMRKLFKFNVRDWLKKPINGSELLEAIRSSVRTSRVSNNRVHAVISAVGGAGATTITISMADIAANTIFRKKNTSVAVFDLDFSTGNCSYLLNMVNGFNLGSVAANPRRIDAEFIRAIQQKHEKGFYLYSFKRPEMNTDLNGYELVLRLLDAVNLEHDHTFLDLPYYETEWKDDVLSAVNTCTIVTELNLPTIKHTLDIIQRVRDLRGNNFPIQVLVNKRSGGLFSNRISKGKLKELFGDTPLFYLPLESNLIGEAIDRGLLPSEVSKRNKFTKSLTKYMKSIELTGGSTAA
ncbi:AAA family ATPase [Roseovarius sp.]|uniref:AAA family ATPase n=1 Tax=Roseovarius sp. TaxID=1486281 RepID=UPI003A96F2C9